MDKNIIIFTPYITIKGRRVYASSYGLRVFRISIPKDKYRRK